MTGLHRTNLTTPQKIDVSAKAVAGQAIHGSVTQLSDEFNISRPTIYNLQESIQKILEEHFNKPESNHKTIQVEVDKNQLDRAIIALRAIAPNSLRAIEDLLPLLYPGLKVSYGVIQAILSGAELNALDFNKTDDLSTIKNSALDEMYSQGDPVLAGIDLASGYLHGLELKETRNGEDWTEFLDKGKQQGMDLEVVVKDAAKGIASGVSSAFPNAEQRDDCFHVLYDMNKLRQKLSNRAYAAIESEYKIQQALEKIKDDEKRKQKQSELLKAIETAQRRIERYDRFEKAIHWVMEAMEYVDLKTGELYSGQDVERMMLDAANILNSIEHHDCKKMAIYIKNRAAGIALATCALNKELNALEANYRLSEISDACRLIRLARQLKKNNPVYLYNKQYQFFLGLFSHIKQKIGAKTDQLIKEIEVLLEKRYRASSAIEGFNSVLRPYLYVHKGVTQNFLELFRAFYNLRTRRWGRNKGTSAHECVTGNKVDDWLTVLGYPPSKPNTLATLH